MQINKIQTYNTAQNTNFTALRLKSGSEWVLNSMPKKALSFVDMVGEDIKNTKYYHIDINRNVSITHISGEKYYYPHNLQLSDKFVILRARGAGQPISKKIKFDTAKQAQEAYQDIINSETQLIKAGKITKYLDLQEIKNSQKPIEEILETDSHETIVQKLLNKYSV